MRYDIEGLIALGQQVVDLAKSKGATVAEAVVGEGAHLSAKVRLGEPELVEEAGSKSLGLRVMRDQQVAVTFTSDLSPAGLTRAVEDALELARLSQPDPCAGPPEPALLSSARDHAELDLFDERVDAIVRIEDVGGRLLPLLRVGDDVVEMAPFDLTNVAARPEIHFLRGAGTAVGLVARYLRRLAFACVRMNRFDQALDHPLLLPRPLPAQLPADRYFLYRRAGDEAAAP